MGMIIKRMIAGAALGALLSGEGAIAQDRRVEITIPPTSLDEALKEISRLSGREIIYVPEAVTGRSSRRISGRMTADDAIRALIAGSDLSADFQREAVVVRRVATPPLPDAGQNITITGSRVRGGRSASPVLVRTRDALREEGLESVAEAVARIPQNFGGGQSPGIGLNTPGSANLNGATTLNLRGLGPDATLTLLNGHRLPYGAQRQSVDVSQIPFVALDRIEIVLDGSSALYGSDAVGGVANLITRRTFEGLLTSARAGWSTGGGNAHQQYGAIGGVAWNGGGAVLSGEIVRNTPIEAAQRAYTKMAAPGLTLYPRLSHSSTLLELRQEIGTGVKIGLEGLYNRRRSEQFYALDLRGDPKINGGGVLSMVESWSVAPRLEAPLGEDWNLTAVATYGEDRSRYSAIGYLAGTVSSSTNLCYCNSASSAEVSVEGEAFHLGAGPVRVALGGGYRRNDLQETNLRIDEHQTATFAYGEVQVPLLAAAARGFPLRSLSASAAMRYERIAGVDDVLTPKLGIIYGIAEGLDLRVSWGQSFRAPTLFQQYSVLNVTVQRASARGGTGYPTTATALQLAGGNPDLKPERASTWTATLGIRPSYLPGLSIEASYFSVDYRDRIVAPISIITTALSNPVYRGLITLAPSPQAKATAIASGTFLNNLGRPYNPDEVIAIIDNRNINAALQRIQGFDASASIERQLGPDASITLRVQASYIDSRQQIGRLQPIVQLSGRVFNPASFRARGGAVLKLDRTIISAFVDRVSGLEDSRAATFVPIDAMTTVDISGRHRFSGRSSLLEGLEIALSLQNALDADPPLITGRQVYEQPYDAANFSPLGRSLSLSITKTW